MQRIRWFFWALVCLTVLTGQIGRTYAQGETSDELVKMVISLLGEKDKDLRALGLEQVRTEAKGEAATKQFAALLPTLPPESQVGLILRSGRPGRQECAARRVGCAGCQSGGIGPGRGD